MAEKESRLPPNGIRGLDRSAYIRYNNFVGTAFSSFESPLIIKVMKCIRDVDRIVSIPSPLLDFLMLRHEPHILGPVAGHQTSTLRRINKARVFHVRDGST
jgi:hypothetical protein